METFDPHKTTTEVRGANRRTENLRVLMIGLAAIIILFGMVYFFFFMGSAGQPTV